MRVRKEKVLKKATHSESAKHVAEIVHEETSEKYPFDFNMSSPIVGPGDPTLESFERIDSQKQH